MEGKGMHGASRMHNATFGTARDRDDMHARSFAMTGSMWNLDESDYSDEGSWPR